LGYVERRIGGLVLAELGMDGAALERELRRRDPLLSLQGWPSLEHRCILWRVVREAGERGPETVCVWQSESGEPYPLSSGLLDLVDRLDRNTRSDYARDDERNARRRDALVRQQERDNEALAQDWTPRHGRPVLPRSQALRMSRDKRRAKGEKC
jgi:hypothetical protein